MYDDYLLNALKKSRRRLLASESEIYKMQIINFETGSTAGPFNDKYVAEIEAEIGIKFPHDFIKLMKCANGGKPAKPHFSLDGNEKVIERFLSLVEDYKNNEFGIYDIEVVWSQIEDRLDEGVCPFAVVFAGDFLCFDFRNKVEPSIVLWGHDDAVQGNPCYQYIADSFHEFSRTLK